MVMVFKSLYFGSFIIESVIMKDPFDVKGYRGQGHWGSFKDEDDENERD